ncbi:MAG: glutamate 5-kinase [Acidiferrobacteraceae bacterium]
MVNHRSDLPGARRVVIKIGSALLTRDGEGLDAAAMDAWVAECAALTHRGIEVVIVSSGAVAAGMHRIGWKTRPRALCELQAMAAIGQMGLIQRYESSFSRHGLHTAQILLTHDDLADRSRYLNARSTLRILLGSGVIPIINENDTVATEEIRFGDNDTLAALVSNLVEADVLLILTDQEGLFDRDPRGHPDARLVRQSRADDASLDVMAGNPGALGRGGMRTKIAAARKAARSGTATVILPGRADHGITRVLAGEDLGTFLVPGQSRIGARKRWLAGQLQTSGRLWLDAGAARVVRESGRSLLAVGVLDVEGEFSRGEIVACLDPEGHEVARGLVNYGAEEVARIKGQPSDRIESLLGYVDEPELIHRDNLVIL